MNEWTKEKPLNVLDKFTCEKNVDRVRFLPFNSNSNSKVTISACYELDKVTKTKSGILYSHSISNNK